MDVTGAPPDAPSAALPDAETLRRRLAEALPEAMVPAVVMTLPRLPLNAHGKIDRSALPPPDFLGVATATWEAPQGEAESAIAAAWVEVLRVPRVGRDDNFFALGGHSLLAAQVMARLQQTLRSDISMAELFQAQTPRALAALWAARPQPLGAPDPARSTDQVWNDLGAYLDDLLETP